MTKQIHLDFLQYVLDHQSPELSYFNRYFLLEDRLHRENGFKINDIANSKTALLKRGFLGKPVNASPFYITDAGKMFLQEESNIHLLGRFEKIAFFIKKYELVSLLRVAGYSYAAVVYVVPFVMLITADALCQMAY